MSQKWRMIISRQNNLRGNRPIANPPARTCGDQRATCNERNKPIITTRSIKPGTQPHTTYEHSTAFNWQSLSGIIMLRLRPTASLCVLTESDPHVLLALPLRNLKIKTNESEIYSTRYWNLKLELALCLMTKASRTWSRFINNMT